MNEGEMKQRYFEKRFDAKELTEIAYDDVLPDYYPDIAKIVQIRCTAIPEGRAFGAKTVRCAGQANVEVSYISAENTPVYRTVSIPYSTEFHADGLDEDTLLTMTPHAENVTCRLTGPRKYALRGRIRTEVSGSSVADAGVAIAGAEGEDAVELAPCHVGGLMMYPGEEKNMKISEDFELPHDMPPIAELLRCELAPQPVECKVADGTASFRTVCRMQLFYRAEPGGDGAEYQSFFRDIPITGSFAAPDVPDGCPAFAECTVFDCTSHTAEDGMGENRLLELDFFADVSAVFYENRTLDAAANAYSVDYEVRTDRKTLHTRQLRVATNANFSVSGKISGDTTPATLLDVRADAVCHGCRQERGRVLTWGDATVTALCADGEGKLFGITGDIPWKFECDGKGLSTDGEFRTAVSVMHCSGRPSADGVAVELELGLTLAAFDTAEESVLSSVTVDPSSPHAKRPAGEILLYYPTPGERLFDIARTHAIRQSALRAANRIPPEKEAVAMEDHVLLIP